jgi:hypothetical protein
MVLRDFLQNDQVRIWLLAFALIIPPGLGPLHACPRRRIPSPIGEKIDLGQRLYPTYRRLSRGDSILLACISLPPIRLEHFLMAGLIQLVVFEAGCDVEARRVFDYTADTGGRFFWDGPGPRSARKSRFLLALQDRNEDGYDAFQGRRASEYGLQPDRKISLRVGHLRAFGSVRQFPLRPLQQRGPRGTVAGRAERPQNFSGQKGNCLPCAMLGPTFSRTKLIHNTGVAWRGGRWERRGPVGSDAARRRFGARS